MAKEVYIGTAVGTEENLKGESSIKVTKASLEKDRSIYKHKTSFQARLGRKLDLITRKTTDNRIRLTSTPVDMIRIRAKRDERTHDLISRIIEDYEVLPIVFPKISGIPMRHLINQDGSLITSLVPFNFEQQQYFEIYCPMECHLNEDDILIRIIFDEPSDRNYVMAFQVKEILGDIGTSSIRSLKYWVTLYDNELSEEIVDTIRTYIKQREELHW